MKMRPLAFAAALCLTASPLLAQRNADRFSGPARVQDYLHSLISPVAILGVAAATTLDQMRDDPPDWNFGNRAGAFTDHDRRGGTYFSVARVAGAYGAAYSEAAWRPGRSGSEAFVAGTSSLVASGVLNLWREFVSR